jgi:hypothetical protein
MAYPRLCALLVATTLAGCNDGDNETEASSGEPPLTTTDPGTGPVGTSTGESSSGTTDPTPTTGSPDETSTGDLSTSSSTTIDPTTGDTGSSDDTGPLCDVGTLNCACDGGGCSDGSLCVADVCVAGLDCPNDVEPPGESEATPVDLGDITDNNDDFFQETGVLSGSNDVDWYSYHGKDTLGYVAEPTYTLISGEHRACLFVVCDNGGAAQTSIECPAGTDFAISPALRPGCCGAASFVLGDFGCPGNDESVEMWLRVDKPAADVCSDYEFKLNF